MENQPKFNDFYRAKTVASQAIDVISTKLRNKIANNIM